MKFSRREMVFISIIIFMIGVTFREYLDPSVNTVWQGFFNGFQSLLIDSSIAILMAVFIAYYFADAENKQLGKVLEDRSQKIAENVYSGVFNSRLPSEYVAKIVEGSFQDVKIIRDFLKITYTLQEYETSADRLKGKGFIRVVAKASMNYRSIATGPDRVSVKPKLMLPNPILDELKADVKIVEYTIRGEKQPLESVNRDILNQLQDDENIGAVGVFKNIELSPNENVEVEATYHMIKEVEDSELLRTFYPCKSMEVNVINDTNLPIAIRARAVHFDKAEGGQVDSTKTYCWKLASFAAPHQGMMVWWKEKPVKKTVANRSINN